MRKWIDLCEARAFPDSVGKLKDGRDVVFKIEHSYGGEEPDDEREPYLDITIYLDGKSIGGGLFDQEDNCFRGVSVKDEFRRLGAATAMYDYMDRLGYFPRPSSDLEPDGQAFWKARRGIAESQSDISDITAIATEFRNQMDQQHPARGYRTLAGKCNSCSRALTAIFKEKGYDAQSIHRHYNVSDPTYIDRHGSAVAGWDEGEWDEYPPEEHEYALVNGYVVDVTSDQFTPSDPEKNKVVVTTPNDPRYR